MARGTLRIYLGAAPGVGKTFAMLNEGCRRRERGTDVVVGFVETHGRAEHRRRRSATSRSSRARPSTTAARPSRRWTSTRSSPARPRSRSSTSSRTPTSRARATRSAGRTSRSCSTPASTSSRRVNIQHLESLNDVVEQITGIKQRETIPDAVVRARRPDRARRHDARGAAAPDGARQHLPGRRRSTPRSRNYFRAGNLGALRELALLWVADRVDEALAGYRERHGIDRPWETRERVVVALTGAPGGDADPPSGADGRAHAGELSACTSARPGRARRAARRACSSEQRALVEELGGEYHEVAGADIGRRARATSPGPRTRPRSCSARAAGRAGRELTRGSVINRVIRDSGSASTST